MTPRLLTRTHYQIDEPAILRLLVQRCTSPIKSDYRGRVAKRLVEEVGGFATINEAAAGYAVDLGRAVGLISEKLTWTERAHLLKLVASDDGSVELSLRERIFFFYSFMEKDGAAVLFFLRTLKDDGVLPSSQRDWARLATELFLSTFRAYQPLTTDLARRTRLRSLIRKQQGKGFTGKSGPHQCFIHLQTLFRVGLIAKDGADSRVYKWDAANAAPALVLERLPDIRALEKLVSDRGLPQLAGAVFGGLHPKPGEDSLVLADIGVAYKRVMATGVPLCSLRTLIELAQIEQIARGETVMSFEVGVEKLKTVQRQRPRQVHFHVDRIGRPAYLKLEPGALPGL